MSPQLWPSVPVPIASGEATVVAGGTAVAFPDGSFAHPPRVTAQIASAAGNLRGATLRVSSISATGCMIYLDAPAGASSSAVDWHALA